MDSLRNLLRPLMGFAPVPSVPNGQVLDYSPFGYLQVDEENRIIYANTAACDLLGLPAPQLTTPLLKWVRSYELDQLIDQTRQSHHAVCKDWQWQRVVPDPENPLPQPSRWLRGHGVWLPQDQIGIYLVDRQEVTSLSERCDRWTVEVAHELKTPLTSMRLIAETLQTRVDGRTKEWIDRLLMEVIRLSDLVQDVLELNQDNDRSPLECRTINLYGLVNSVWQTLEPLAQRRKVQMDCAVPPEIRVWGDERRLYRLILNLLDNAIKHSPSLQKVLIAAEICPPAMVVIDVIDCGDGFTPESIDHAFERFYRGDPSRCRYGNEQGGCGLGLAIARYIVELHRGTIEVMNNADTGGGQVRVCLPLHLAPQPSHE
jgi:two-component system phosphate regulon sensor histidine kinase PhoR